MQSELAVIFVTDVMFFGKSVVLLSYELQDDLNISWFCKSELGMLFKYF